MSERAQALEAALRALRNECHAIKSMSYDEIKASAGYTNLKCWMDRMDEVDALLAVQPPPPVGSPTTEHEHDYVTVELCRHCLRTEADITGECHHCGEGTGARCWWCLKLKSASAQASDPPKTWIPTEGCSCYLCRAARFSPTPVSPVAPEPPTNPACKRCGHALLAHRPEFGVCDGSTRPCACPEFVSPTGAPAPCVWRDISTTQPAVDDIVLVYEEGHIGKALLDASGRWLDVEAGRDDAWFSVPPSHWMPFPTPPLTVER